HLHEALAWWTPSAPPSLLAGAAEWLERAGIGTIPPNRSPFPAPAEPSGRKEESSRGQERCSSERPRRRRKERTMQYPDDFSRARRVARATRAFFIHLTAYALVNALLLGINLGTSTAHLWFKWPLLGWGVGLLGHAAVAFLLPSSERIRRGRT